MQLIPVILCGGVGARLWPASRELYPKPFIRLPDGYSLLQKSALRGAMLPGVKNVVTVANRDTFFKVKEELDEINLTNQTTSFILEPFARNTAAAMAVAALHIAQIHGEDALMLGLAADCLAIDQDAFQHTISVATELALSGKLITFGMRPYETNAMYGSTEPDENNVLRFVLKPSTQMMNESLPTNKFLRSSSHFLFKAGALLQAMKEHCPDILSATLECLNQSELTEEDHSLKLDLDPTSFFHIPDRSIDDAVITKSAQTSVVPCDLSWIDMGSWNTLGSLLESDSNNNRIAGQTCLYDVANCHIQGSNRLIGAVGVENLIIIDTPDALLVANKYCAHDVKHIYTQLKRQNHEAHKLHQTVHHLWGSETLLEECAQFKIRRVVVRPGESLNVEANHKSNHWLVVSGMAKVSNEASTFFINTNESTYISAKQPHCLENPGTIDLVIIEVQSGDCLDKG